MARIRKTFPKSLTGYYHRVHRSKRGQRNIKIGEDKITVYFTKKKKDNKLLVKTDKRKIMRLPRAEEVKNKEKKKKVSQEWKCQDKPPGLICENCGARNGLNFHPLREPEELARVKCQECEQLAFYSHYWAPYEILDPIIFLTYGWLRDMIKNKQIRLLDLILC